MLSGIGPGDHLKEMDIEVKHHLPGVGQNLQDHLEVYVQHKCTKPVSLYKYQWKFPHYMISAGLQWFYNQTGTIIAFVNHLIFYIFYPKLGTPKTMLNVLPLKWRLIVRQGIA